MRLAVAEASKISFQRGACAAHSSPKARSASTSRAGQGLPRTRLKPMVSSHVFGAATGESSGSAFASKNISEARESKPLGARPVWCSALRKT